MNELAKLKKKVEIKSWLDLMDIKKYTINEDLTVDVEGYVVIRNRGLRDIPVQFGKVGEFDVSGNSLRSTKGFPVSAEIVWCEENLDILFRPENIKCVSFYNYSDSFQGFREVSDIYDI